MNRSLRAASCGLAFSCAVLAGCGDSPAASSSGSGTLTAKPSDTGAAQKLFVLNSTGGNGTNADTILAFSPTANGTTTPTQTINVSSASAAFAGVDVDGAGSIYASVRTTSGTTTTGLINVYSSTATGVATPTRSFTPGLTSSNITFPGPLSVDRAGNIYVNSESLEAVYPASASTGTVPASFSLTAGASQVYYPSGSYVDANNNFYLAQTFGTAVSGSNQGVLIFNSGVAATSAPARTLLGSSTGLQTVTFVAGDKSGNVYVSGSNSNGAVIEIFSPTATGNAAPTKIISGALTGLLDPRGIAVDGTGTIYILNGARSTPSISTFSAASIASCQTCNVAPTTTFTSTAFVKAQGALAIY